MTVVAVHPFVVHAFVVVVVCHVRYVSSSAVRFDVAVVDQLLGYCHGVCIWCCSRGWVALSLSC